jgi:ABC-type transporter MlaC component
MRLAKLALLILVSAGDLLSAPKLKATTLEAESVVRAVQQLALTANSTGDQVPKSTLQNYFDLAAIAKGMLGPFWAAANETERDQFTSVLSDLIAGRLKRYLADGGQPRLGVLSSHQLPGKMFVVTAKLARGPDRISMLEWRLRQDESKHLIVDVVTDGRSLVATRREDFQTEMRSTGVSLGVFTEKVKARAARRLLDF